MPTTSPTPRSSGGGSVATGSGRIVFTSDTLTPGLAKFGVKLGAAIDAFMDHQATKTQDFMRTNAPWNDQTGNARNGLFARSELGAEKWTIVCYHTVPYGIWLEVVNSGKNEILTTTVQKEGARIMQSLGNLLDKAALAGL